MFKCYVRSDKSRRKTRMRFRPVVTAISFRVYIYVEIFQTAVECTFPRQFYPALVAPAVENSDVTARHVGYWLAVRRGDISRAENHGGREGEGEVSIWPSYDNTTADNFRIPIHGQSNGKNGNPSVISVMDSFDSTSICVPPFLCAHRARCAQSRVFYAFTAINHSSSDQSIMRISPAVRWGQSSVDYREHRYRELVAPPRRE